MNCHCLVTVLDPPRIDMATLVFKTLRVGFPNANVQFYLNGDMPNGSGLDISLMITDMGFERAKRIPRMSHGRWIEILIASKSEPFWIVGGDVVFFEEVENWYGSGNTNLFAGRYEPEFFEPWTKTIHVARLHPSLMWINPVPLRAAMRGWPGKHEFFDSVQKNLIQWHWVPSVMQMGGMTVHRGTKFYDTCAGLHHALGGHAFDDQQNAAFEHLLCGSYAHLMPGMAGLEAVHRGIVADPKSARGLQHEQAKWYAENVVL